MLVLKISIFSNKKKKEKRKDSQSQFFMCVKQKISTLFHRIAKNVQMKQKNVTNHSQIIYGEHKTTFYKNQDTKIHIRDEECKTNKIIWKMRMTTNEIEENKREIDIKKKRCV